MVRFITGALAATALAGFVSVSAQERTPTQPEKERGGDDRSRAAVTLTGCVQQAKTQDGATAYVLTNAEGSAATASMYVLSGASSSELSSRVNQKVQVTGMLQQSSSSQGGSSRTGDERQSTTPPQLSVQSLKMVASSCQ